MTSNRSVREVPVVRRQPWSEAEARKVLEEQSRSGLTIWAFARSRGLAVKRLYDWQRRLMGTTASPPVVSPPGLPVGSSWSKGKTVPFVPVRICSPAPAYEKSAESEGVIELLVAPNRRIRVPDGFDENTLSRLLRVLDAEVVC